MALIYCVEDDESIRELIAYALKAQGFEAVAFGDGKDFWEGLKREIPDLLLLDIMLPGESGIEILEKLRNNGDYKHIPVIMLTAKTSEYDVVKGLDKGADDYVCKPFGIIELISRIRAVLRRRPGENLNNAVYSYGPIVLNTDKHEVRVDGELCRLTAKEFELLRYLLVNIDIVLKRDQIMEAVWGFTYAGESRTIDMHVKSLRHKLGNGGSVIRTVRGVGYVVGGHS
ncbi:MULTISPECIES: response regulator transcription factor [Megasphaera]|uniref:Putative sensory transduction protein RegX3 n=1 Tax=Megasphaera vaginalis (ex Srinivasan et al. 2021) TaxID=1111454 RepID=U7UMA9_9FIRM|nr:MULTISPECIES: response regulator transcription factor [Megasphaera]ERT60552.1 putative sensory transduction protein RegX3 [Megasphaera vaginalis (ex Srinivasan et al. 2021)]